MAKPIHVLIIEDSELDARVLVSVLKKGGYDPAFEHVETREELARALERPAERLEDARLRALARLLGDEGRGRPLSGRETHARGVLDALPAYRNRVIGHGSVRKMAKR